MSTFYNDFEPYAAEWLRNLSLIGEITPGDVSSASLLDLEGWQLAAYNRVHLCAGIGGWDLALQLAGWPVGRPVWTGSFPCQPFSAAGKQKGESDERHIWPYGRQLIAECKPPIIFGEQVASKLGREWLAGVRADLEALGYAVGAADLCSPGVGAPHIRQRLYWMAYSLSAGRAERWPGTRSGQTARSSEFSRVADDDEQQRDRTGSVGQGRRIESADSGELSRLVYSESEQEGFSGQPRQPRRRDQLIGLGDDDDARLERRRILSERPNELSARSSGMGNFWRDYDIVNCLDGKARRIESGTFPLAHGVPARVGKLRAYGNAIVPQVAATFVKSVMEIL